MKKYTVETIVLLIIVLMIGCKKKTGIENTQEEHERDNPTYVITQYGAVGDGKTDCSGVINKIIKSLPASGGTIVIPEGDFLLDNPIIIDRDFVTIKGLNPGLRSNVDVPLEGVRNPGGGSKLLVGKAEAAIEVPNISNENGVKKRISGLMIKNMLISGGEHNNGIGINILHDNDGVRIENVVGINLQKGIVAVAADAMIISSCWLSECAHSIEMTHGIQNMINNCQLGAQPGGVTVKLTDQENFIMNGNHVYPDGDVNLQLNDCRFVNVTANNFQSYYLGMIELNNSHSNILTGNVVWMRLPSDPNRQLRGEDNDYGVIRVSGNQNMLSNSTITCDWANEDGDPVSIRSINGEGNSYYNLKFENMNSNRLMFVNETTEIFHSVPPDKVFVDGDINNILIKY